MRQGQFTLSSQVVQEHVAGLLERFLGLPDYSGRCTAATVWLVLCAAAARLTSIFAICQHLDKAPSDETVRQALLNTLPEYAELQRRVNRALQGDLPKTLRRQRQRLAIKVPLLPYRGQPFADAKARTKGAQRGRGSLLLHQTHPRPLFFTYRRACVVSNRRLWVQTSHLLF